MRTTRKFLKRFFKSIFSFSVLCMLGLNASAQMSKALETAVKTQEQKPDVHVYVNKQTDANGNVTRYDSVYTWSFNSGKAGIMQPLDRDWLNKFHRQNSAIYRALPGTTYWNIQKMQNTFMQSMREMQQSLIKVFNEPFFIPWQHKLPEKSSTKKASVSAKDAALKTT